jgi:autotransporter-associated beta strand protein
MEFGGTSTLNQVAGYVFANNGTFSWNSTGSSTISNNITGTGAITKNNTGTLTLTGVANTYNGSTTVSGGTLQLGGNITSSALTLNSGGVISVGTSSTITTINKVNTASITLNGGSRSMAAQAMPSRLAMSPPPWLAPTTTNSQPLGP